MATKKYYAFKPDYSLHPGEYLEEVIGAREIKKRELAERLGISVKHLSQIINKQEPVSSELAVKLERTLGVSATIWNNLNADYALFEARHRESETLNQDTDWIKSFPVSDLIKHGFLQATKNKAELTAKLLEFFGIPAIGQWKEFYALRTAAQFRKSDKFKLDMPHVSAWLRAGEILAGAQAADPFSKDGFKKNLSAIRKLTVGEPRVFEPEMKRLCAQAGVALVFVPEFRKTHLSGATRWLTAEKALIVMSLRYKANDHFWFTFFHEAAHILLHAKKAVFIDDEKGYRSKEEDEANEFARNMLVPEAEYKAFIARGSFFPMDIESFARSIGIHPGIVVGLLQHDGHIKYAWHNELKARFEFVARV